MSPDPTDPPRIVGIFLVDPRGHVLLQERDEFAPLAPLQWGIVGGHVDPGEPWATARDRELLEETGLQVPASDFTLWFEGRVSHHELGHAHDWKVWVAPVSFTDEDVVCGEGRQIVFVDPVDFAQLDQSESLQHFLPLLMDSDAYRKAASRRR